MFARRIRVEYEENGRRHACPLKWLDSFSMRNFTNATVFDNTLPVADGVMEIGTHVPLAGIESGDGRLVRKEELSAEGWRFNSYRVETRIGIGKRHADRQLLIAN